MKIAVISDIHGNLAYLKKAKKIINDKKIKTVLCCGDIQTKEVFSELDSWNNKVFLVLGNADYKLAEDLDSGVIYPEKLSYFKDFGVVNLVGKKIAFTHYDFMARKLAAEKKYNLIFYGHTHTPWEEKILQTALLNPGEIAGQFGKSTFAIYDLQKMSAELIII